MNTLIILAGVCYAYGILITVIISHFTHPKGASLSFLFVLPAVMVLVLWFLGGIDLLRLVAVYPLRLLAQLS